MCARARARVPLTNVGMVAGPVRGVCVTMPTTKSSCAGLAVNDLLDVTNLGQNPISVIAKKSANVNVLAFNVTVEEWYGAANVPGFLDKDSLISDFFVDIFVIGATSSASHTSTQEMY